ncbi:uncharacterized protein BT62DRAFT_1000213 [Guyanagaster necrorhizus]|uniref:Uncharacterized protein n=1 Tax=Guyanagaster necrorhizus TaxID=856835 RepID=A0A9P7W2R7_9AGAR|nr:uncharacterized protein BT62DRAFT_1000213 [Guyanagaster necrorhizus MCA 3950]KAG7450974.1 hypothetical protein BT62DRAFT_1000213 [Guyanagaster necrorhizus MCA 3950]
MDVQTFKFRRGDVQNPKSQRYFTGGGPKHGGVYAGGGCHLSYGGGALVSSSSRGIEQAWALNQKNAEWAVNVRFAPYLRHPPFECMKQTLTWDGKQSRKFASAFMMLRRSVQRHRMTVIQPSCRSENSA